MSTNESTLKDLISHLKAYGYVYGSSEIYDGLSAVYDYGPMGVELKNNIKKYWWKAMVELQPNIVGLDAAIFMHPTTWKASGHVDAFDDPMIDNKDSKKRYRADVLIEEYVAKLEGKIEKEVQKAIKRFGNDFDKEKFLSESPRVLSIKKQAEEIIRRMVKGMEGDLNDLKLLIEELNIVCPVSGTKNWTDVKRFNLMFATQMGSVSAEASTIYLRPETAQGIFVNFLNVQKTTRQKIPFGIAQIGKAFRNEIVARQFIFRMKEFEQMEMQYFVSPGTELEWFEKWKAARLRWHHSMGLGEDNYRYHDHDKLAHYANAATDIEFRFPFGFKELEGIHSRTDFDLGAHQEYSNKKQSYYDPDSKESYVPYVVETSIGLDRMFLAILHTALKDEALEDGSTRKVLSIPPMLAPYKVAILPLVKKEVLTIKAKEIYEVLKWDTHATYDDKDSIGKRYRRQDALGTPFCITIDFDTVEKDGMVTIRHRDSMQQDRIKIEDVSHFIQKHTSMTEALKKI